MSTESAMRAGDIRQHNEKMILQSIYQSGATGRSQSEIVSATGLKAPTVLRFFLELESQGYICALPVEEAQPQKAKGRPPVRYVMNRSKQYTIGIEFWAEHLSLAVFDFQGLRVCEKNVRLPSRVSAFCVAGAIASLIGEALEENGIDPESVIGAGIGAPGKVHTGEGTVIYYPRISGMKNFKLAQTITKLTGLRVKVHNNCSVLALGEFRYGEAQKEETLFMFLLRSGVNGTFINKGHIYTTSLETTIETGHIPVSYDGPLCSCGKRGCLEAWILSAYRENPETLFGHLEKQIAESDPIAMDELRKSALYIHTAMRNINNIFKPKAYLFVAMSRVIADALSFLVQELDRQEPKAFDSETIGYYSGVYDAGRALKGASDLIMDDFFR